MPNQGGSYKVEKGGKPVLQHRTKTQSQIQDEVIKEQLQAQNKLTKEGSDEIQK